MAKKTGAQTAYENPLIPNARLREIYRAMLHTQMLAHSLPRQRRGQTLGFEACQVSTSIDLGPGDLVSDALDGAPIEFLRGAPLASVLHPNAAAKKRAPSANCGKASRLPSAPAVAERIWSTLGAASALKTQAAQAKAAATESTSHQSSVVIAYVLPRQMQPALWQETLAFAAEHTLPVIFVVLPAAHAPADKTHPAKLAGISAIALRCHVPGIPVDADDAVAIYRVAQEAIGHARIGAGPALLECVPCPLPHAQAKPNSDAIAGLEQYMLQRSVATRAWMNREASAFARRIAR